MGEMADWDSDEQDDPIEDSRQLYEDGVDEGGYLGTGIYRKENDPRFKTCVNCGTKYLFWGKIKRNGRWKYVLCDENGVHKCPIIPKPVIEKPKPRVPNEEMKDCLYDLRYIAKELRALIQSGESATEFEIDSIVQRLHKVQVDLIRETSKIERKTI